MRAVRMLQQFIFKLISDKIDIRIQMREKCVQKK